MINIHNIPQETLVDIMDNMIDCIFESIYQMEQISYMDRTNEQDDHYRNMQDVVIDLKHSKIIPLL